MRTTLKAAALGAAASLFLLGGCETLNETYTLDENVIIDSQGVRVTSELQEDFFGNRSFQFRAFNSNNFDVCVAVTLKEGSYTSGHSFDGIHRVGPAQLVDVGYIQAPADFRVNAEISSPDDDDVCR